MVDLAHENGIAENTLYHWNSKFSSMASAQGEQRRDPGYYWQYQIVATSDGRLTLSRISW
jgi:transposase-like protein